MERNDRVFVDSSYFVAFFNTSDSLHQKALRIGRRLEAASIERVISNYVFLEVVTVLAQRADKKTALLVGSHLASNPLTRVIHIDESLHRMSWEIFKQVAAKNVSFVDCSNLAVMNAEGIASVLTFDRTDIKAFGRIYKFRLFD